MSWLFGVWCLHASGQQLRKQGVGDVWTDPQFHTSYPTAEFGKGNLEQMGIDGFFKSHKCNSICEFLGIGKVCCSALMAHLPALRSFVISLLFEVQFPPCRMQKLGWEPSLPHAPLAIQAGASSRIQR